MTSPRFLYVYLKTSFGQEKTSTFRYIQIIQLLLLALPRWSVNSIQAIAAAVLSRQARLRQGPSQHQHATPEFSPEAAGDCHPMGPEIDCLYTHPSFNGLYHGLPWFTMVYPHVTGQKIQGLDDVCLFAPSENHLLGLAMTRIPRMQSLTASMPCWVFSITTLPVSWPKKTQSRADHPGSLKNLKQLQHVFESF